MARYLIFLTFVNVYLALLSLLPIPSLDGGHIVFLAIEGLLGRPVGRNVQSSLIIVSLVAVLLLTCMLVVPCISQLFRLRGLMRSNRVREPSLDSPA
jgi:regulator of sigma E protease